MFFSHFSLISSFLKKKPPRFGSGYSAKAAEISENLRASPGPLVVAEEIESLVTWRDHNIAKLQPWKITLQGTNISPQNGFLMIFLFPRWEMLIPWMINWLELTKSAIFLFKRKMIWTKPPGNYVSMLIFKGCNSSLPEMGLLKRKMVFQPSIFSCYVCFRGYTLENSHFEPVISHLFGTRNHIFQTFICGIPCYLFGGTYLLFVRVLLAVDLFIPCCQKGWGPEAVFGWCIKNCDAYWWPCS